MRSAIDKRLSRFGGDYERGLWALGENLAHAFLGDAVGGCGIDEVQSPCLCDIEEPVQGGIIGQLKGRVFDLLIAAPFYSAETEAADAETCSGEWEVGHFHNVCHFAWSQG